MTRDYFTAPSDGDAARYLAVPPEGRVRADRVCPVLGLAGLDSLLTGRDAETAGLDPAAGRVVAGGDLVTDDLVVEVAPGLVAALAGLRGDLTGLAGQAWGLCGVSWPDGPPAGLDTTVGHLVPLARRAVKENHRMYCRVAA